MRRERNGGIGGSEDDEKTMMAGVESSSEPQLISKVVSAHEPVDTEDRSVSKARSDSPNMQQSSESDSSAVTCEND